MATRFLELKDTPNSYQDAEGKIVVVSGDGLVFKDDSTIGGATTFNQLEDVSEYPGAITANYKSYLTGNGSSMVYKQYYSGNEFATLENVPAVEAETWVKWDYSSQGILYDEFPPNKYRHNWVDLDEFNFVNETPNTYIRVQSTTGFENYGGTESTYTWDGLLDTETIGPDDNDKYVYVHNEKLVYHDDNFSTFTSLLDTPNSYSGVAVNSLVEVRPNEKSLHFGSNEESIATLSYMAFKTALVNPLATITKTSASVMVPVKIDLADPNNGYVLNEQDFELIDETGLGFKYTGEQEKTFNLAWSLNFVAQTTNGFNWLINCSTNLSEPVTYPGPEYGWVGREGNGKYYYATGNRTLSLSKDDTFYMTTGIVNDVDQTPLSKIGEMVAISFSLTVEELY